MAVDYEALPSSQDEEFPVHTAILVQFPSPSKRRRTVRLVSIISTIINIIGVIWLAQLVKDRSSYVVWRGARPIYSTPEKRYLSLAPVGLITLYSDLKLPPTRLLATMMMSRVLSRVHRSTTDPRPTRSMPIGRPSMSLVCSPLSTNILGESLLYARRHGDLDHQERRFTSRKPARHGTMGQRFHEIRDPDRGLPPPPLSRQSRSSSPVLARRTNSLTLLEPPKAASVARAVSRHRVKPLRNSARSRLQSCRPLHPSHQRVAPV